MAIGTVKFFNYDRGFGFVSNDAGGPDAFVHIKAVEAAGLPGLNKNQRISYALDADGKGRTIATGLERA
ncbi:cold-shock protein [Sphingosinicella sp. BN140058]|uniref:cold-shock protein n=1 Tax=Sphingosinicella sp. BN140058 TaxID=1892855 RepID=UPI001011BB3D|nr:cold shock domain-containing protein [Sphingosinicella sp. BN140058]QAY79031.1 cold-shock protein [Sphingosinicella sp. BN140058]